jgi:hypothetical protein
MFFTEIYTPKHARFECGITLVKGEFKGKGDGEKTGAKGRRERDID